MELLSYIKEVAKEFYECEINGKKPLLIYTHYDADGISAAAIFVKTLITFDKPFNLRILKSLEKEKLKEIKKEAEGKSIIFLDLASSFIEEFNKFDERIWIIDHHKLDKNIEPGENVKIINYRFFNEVNVKDYETSSSVLAYFFANSLLEYSGKKDKNIAKFALLGLIGDGMDKELSKLSSYFIKDLKEMGEVEIKRGLKVFSYSRPIHKALEFSSIYIPEITGNNESVINFLRNLGIETKNNGKYRTFNDLTKEELSKIITAIATFNLENNGDLDLIGNVYFIKIFEFIEDAKEIATMLNACGRLDKGYVALSFLLGNKKAKEEVDKIYTQYKFEIFKALEKVEEWLKNNSEYVIKETNFMIINAKRQIRDSIIGTITSMLANSGIYKKNFVIVGLAYREDGIKVSLRMINGKKALELLDKVRKLSNLDFDLGGHDSAAGAIIKHEHEEIFLKYLEKVLREESVTIKI